MLLEEDQWPYLIIYKITSSEMGCSKFQDNKRPSLPQDS